MIVKYQSDTFKYFYFELRTACCRQVKYRNIDAKLLTNPVVSSSVAAAVAVAVAEEW